VEAGPDRLSRLPNDITTERGIKKSHIGPVVKSELKGSRLSSGDKKGKGDLNCVSLLGGLRKGYGRLQPSQLRSLLQKTVWGKKSVKYSFAA